MGLQVYNTLTRKKEPFQTVHPGKKVGMYVCGPTVYKPSHIGHMVGPVIFDAVKRYLTYLGYEVTWVVNITDVDDKLIVRARELGTTVKELAERMTADYVDALRKLNVTGIDHMPKATEHIPEMIAIMQGLIDKGYAYPAGGDVYFDVTKDSDYGKLCNRDPEQMEAGARIEVSDKKRNPGDFALWKGSKPGEPAWDSPWGKGRPGWHIECSAMSMKLLGQTLDIHGGGLDLQFPHHENELAQSESYTEKPFASYWMHNGLLKMGKAKMAGSVGNVINVADLLQRHSSETVRFLLLSTHYRSPIEYSEERLAEIQRGVENFYRFFQRFKRITGKDFYSLTPGRTPEEYDNTRSDARLRAKKFQWHDYQRRFTDAMDEDFNTAGAIAVLFDFLNGLNSFSQANELEEANVEPKLLEQFHYGVQVFRNLSSLLGLFDEQPSYSMRVKLEAKGEGIPDYQLKNLQDLLTKIGNQDVRDVDPQHVSLLVPSLIDARAEARKAKNFALGDAIRKVLAENRIHLDDRTGRTEWRDGPRTFSLAVGDTRKVQLPGKQSICQAKLSKENVAEASIDPSDRTMVSLVARAKGTAKLTLIADDGTTEEVQIVV